MKVSGPWHGRPARGK